MFVKLLNDGKYGAYDWAKFPCIVRSRSEAREFLVDVSPHELRRVGFVGQTDTPYLFVHKAKGLLGEYGVEAVLLPDDAVVTPAEISIGYEQCFSKGTLYEVCNDSVGPKIVDDLGNSLSFEDFNVYAINADGVRELAASFIPARGR